MDGALRNQEQSAWPGEPGCQLHPEPGIQAWFPLPAIPLLLQASGIYARLSAQSGAEQAGPEIRRLCVKQDKANLGCLPATQTPVSLSIRSPRIKPFFHLLTNSCTSRWLTHLPTEKTEPTGAGESGCQAARQPLELMGTSFRGPKFKLLGSGKHEAKQNGWMAFSHQGKKKPSDEQDTWGRGHSYPYSCHQRTELEELRGD